MYLCLLYCYTVPLYICTCKGLLRYLECIPDPFYLPDGEDPARLCEEQLGQPRPAVGREGDVEGRVLPRLRQGDGEGAEEPLLPPVPQVHREVRDTGHSQQKLLMTAGNRVGGRNNKSLLDKIQNLNHSTS